MEDTIKRIEQRLNDSAIAPAEKQKLLELVGSLRKELEQIPQEKRDEAGSVAEFAEVAASQALKENKNPALVEHASEGVNKAMEGMAQDYPSLTRVVGQFCDFLSSMGI